MKKTLLLIYFVLTGLDNFNSQSQSPPFMIGAYYADYIATQDSAYRLGCGISTKIKEGYVSFGYNNHISNSTQSFFCNKNFSATGYGDSFIWKGYEMYDGNDCSGNLVKVPDCDGITAVEVKGPNAQRYVIAGTYSKAVFLTTIDSIGNVIGSMTYPFPHLVSQGYPPPSKPFVIKSDVQNQYYICGTFESSMYILNVDITGNIIWSKYYNYEHGISPRDLIMDPYQSNNLVIVGLSIDENNDKNGFFMKVDGTNGIVTQTRLFGLNNNSEEFRSIIPGAYINANNQQGYVLSGYSETSGASLTLGNAWVLKLDVSGNVIWNRLLIPTIGTNTGCVDVTERLNTSNNYEYYALIASSAGMQVTKLDDNGIPFQHFVTNGLDNEYTYTRIPSTCVPVNIDYVNTISTLSLTGIQVYGTLYSYNGQPFVNGSYIVGAYFNGKTNCAGTYQRVSAIQEGHPFLRNVNPTSFGSFSTCSHFLVTSSYGGILHAYQCSSLIPSGSNQRTASSGEPLELLEEKEKLVSVYPNPVINKTTVTYVSQEMSKVSISLHDVTGRVITNIRPESKAEGTYTEEIDFTNLDLSGGIYFLTISVDGILTKEKIVYN